MALGLLLVLVYYLKSNKQLGSRNLKQSTKQYLLITIYLLLFTSFIFSFSRAAWLGFVVGVIVLLFILVIQKKYYQQKELLIIILISVALTSLIYSQYSNLFQTRLCVDSRLENISYVERVSSINDSKIIIKNNILFGTGIGNYVIELKRNTINSHPSWYYQPVHNVFLLVWSEVGIFGLLFFILLLLYLLFNSYKNKKYFNIAIILSLIVIMMFDHWWWSLHFGVLFWWFILGMVYREIIKEKIDK
jgi:O-antigen ligase